MFSAWLATEVCLQAVVGCEQMRCVQTLFLRIGGSRIGIVPLEGVREKGEEILPQTTLRPRLGLRDSKLIASSSDSIRQQSALRNLGVFARGFLTEEEIT